MFLVQMTKERTLGSHFPPMEFVDKCDHFYCQCCKGSLFSWHNGHFLCVDRED